MAEPALAGASPAGPPGPEPEPTLGAPGCPPLGRLDPGGPYPLDPKSVLRRVASEPVVALLVDRALVMELAHPKVGAAVADHSQFRRRPVSRLFRTSDAALRILFGDADLARGAVRQIYRVHDRVFGTTPAFTYSAHDATLLLWVWATLVDSLEAAFTRWVRPWEEGEADAYYADMAAGARFFGIPSGLVPTDRAAFRAYLDEMLDSPELGSSLTSRTVVRDVLWLRHPLVPPPVVRTLRVLALVTLDERLRDRLGLVADPADRRLGERLDRLLGRSYRHLPAWRRRLPYLYLALRRPTLAGSLVGGAERLRHGARCSPWS
jgi:uncharacterized protein (DUF2236 family)